MPPDSMMGKDREPASALRMGETGAITVSPQRPGQAVAPATVARCMTRRWAGS